MERSLCHNCLSVVEEDDLLHHFGCQECKTKCDKCHEEVPDVNCFVPDPAYDDDFRLHQQSTECQEKSSILKVCPNCCVKFQNEQEFSTHKLEKCPIRCGHCSVRFCRRLTRKQHARTCLGLTCACYHCHTIFEGPQRKQEYETHLNNCETNLACSICQFKFSGEKAVKKYTRHYQKGDHKKTCEHCGVEIISQFLDYAYKRHLHIHHHDIIEQEELPAECDNCGVDFGTIRSNKKNKWVLLQEHLQDGCFNHNYHGKEAECIVCHKTFQNEGTNHQKQRTLKRHYNNGCEPLQCPRCKINFEGKPSKTRNFRRHAKKCKLEPAVDAMVVEVPDTEAVEEAIPEEEGDMEQNGDVDPNNEAIDVVNDFHFEGGFEGAVHDDSEDEALILPNGDTVANLSREVRSYYEFDRYGQIVEVENEDNFALLPNLDDAKETNILSETIYIDNVAVLKLRPKFSQDVALTYEDIEQNNETINDIVMEQYNNDVILEEEEAVGVEAADGGELYEELRDIGRQNYGRHPLHFYDLDWVDPTKLPWHVETKDTIDFHYEKFDEVMYIILAAQMNYIIIYDELRFIC